MKPFNEVTIGDFQTMSPELRKAWDDEWLRRVTRDDGHEVQRDYDFVDTRQRYELGE